MLDAARRLIAPSLRSDVPPFMVMDVMAAAARIEAAGRACHPHGGRPAGGAGAGDRHCGRAIRAVRGASPIPIRSAFRRCARALRGTMSDTYGVAVDPARIAVTTGSSAGFILAFLALFEAGDRVAVAVPGYPPYRHILSALGCQPVRSRPRRRRAGRSRRTCCIAEHRKAPLKGVLIASPANPTGTMMTAEALRDLVDAAEGEGIKFISDEIYHGLDYAFPAETAAKLSDSAVIINSFSKYFCMTGWRIGWMVLPEPLIRPIDRLQGNLAISVPALSQIAAEAAFDGRAEMEAVKHGYEENRRILLDGLPKRGFSNILPVDGAFYLYADVSRFCDDSFEFAKRMLEETHVAATPGVDFDPLKGKHFIRFCYAGSAEEMREAVERIGKWLK